MKFVFNKDAIDAYRMQCKAMLASGAMSFADYTSECKRMMQFVAHLSIDIAEDDYL